MEKLVTKLTTKMELWISRFLLHLRSQRNFSPHTLRAYKSDLAVFLQFCRGRKALAVEKIDKLLVRTYLARLQDTSRRQKEFSRNSVLRKISSLRSFISYLLD